MSHNIELGRWGEDLAAAYMEEKGWYVRHRDWRYNHTDIDLVCIDEEDTTLVFVEVKTRATPMFGRPSLAVDAEKRRNIVNAARAYKHSFRKENRMARYDIISIVGTPDTKADIEHIEEAFNMLDVFEDFCV